MDQPERHLELLALMARGSEAALAELYAVFKNRVYNTALSFLQDTAEAEEVTQDVFVKIYHAAARFEGKSSVSTWVYRITVNQSLSRLSYRNRQKRFGWIVRFAQEEHPQQPNIDIPHFDHPGVLLEQKENARMLFKAIESLPEQQKTAFILSFIEELPRQEVATVMDLSLKAVESLLQRAKVNLRKKLDEFYPDRRI
ncbi:MAG: RNA polymerase sigma factor [Saprospiraceae bacterium]|nr:RNA polymerase sigma factor [Saprospiraceae bacterium]